MWHKWWSLMIYHLGPANTKVKWKSLAIIFCVTYVCMQVCVCYMYINIFFKLSNEKNYSKNINFTNIFNEEWSKHFLKKSEHIKLKGKTKV